MYKCNNCGMYVTGKTYKVGPESIEPPETVCSECGSLDIENADYCKYCGQPKEMANDMCDDCDEKMANLTSGCIHAVEAGMDVDFYEAKALLIEYLED